MFVANTSRTVSTDERTFDTGTVPVYAVREDHSFTNQWGNAAGAHEHGAVRRGRMVLARLAHSTARQYSLTGAGRDYTWYSLRAPGKPAVYLREDDRIFIGAKGGTPAEWFAALDLLSTEG